jgi:hypothetical protein
MFCCLTSAFGLLWVLVEDTTGREPCQVQTRQNLFKISSMGLDNADIYSIFNVHNTTMKTNSQHIDTVVAAAKTARPFRRTLSLSSISLILVSILLLGLIIS